MIANVYLPHSAYPYKTLYMIVNVDLPPFYIPLQDVIYDCNKYWMLLLMSEIL